ncbi:hypothetical protein AURANDRAFT_23121, partial [Aureococcus anophagefferens]
MGDAARTERIKVMIRVRPLVALETDGAHRSSDTVVETTPTEVVLHGAEARHQLACAFDTVLGPGSTQEDVYGHVGDCVDTVAQGYNATVLAYGQTGSGKTHTMFGAGGWSESPGGWSGGGIIPRAVAALFDALPRGAQVFASFLQVYREQVYDMLRDGAMDRPLEIHEEALSEGGGTFVSGLSEYGVRSAADCVNLVRAGEANRATRETQMNASSSRSHSIFTLLVEQKRVDDDGGGEVTLRSKFNLVDLAGSEKWDARQAMGDARVAEMTRINLSLHTLGKCVAALAARAKRRGGAPGDAAHVPYRESKLTRLLADSLGGNSLTRLIATLSPAADCVDESVSTLRFADRARSVVVSVRRNLRRPVDHALVQRLQSEVQRLRAILD